VLATPCDGRIGAGWRCASERNRARRAYARQAVPRADIVVIRALGAGNSALEADMVELGVVAMQKSRARQGFQRSADQEKLGKGRLVLPAGYL
jgi:hypothetical protein